jgi:hypothetical protein
MRIDRAFLQKIHMGWSLPSARAGMYDECIACHSPSGEIAVDKVQAR